MVAMKPYYPATNPKWDNCHLNHYPHWRFLLKGELDPLHVEFVFAYLWVGRKILHVVDLKGECTCLFSSTLLSIIIILATIPLVDNIKRYFPRTSLKTIWSLFAYLFISPSITSLRIARDMVGVLWKLVTFMSASFGVNMDLSKDLRLSFTQTMVSLGKRTTMGIRLPTTINMSPSSFSFNPTSTSQPIEIIPYSGNHFSNMFKTWAMWRVVGMLPLDNHFAMLSLKH